MGIDYIVIAGFSCIAAMLLLIAWTGKHGCNFREDDGSFREEAKDNYFYLIIFFGCIALLFEIIGFCVGI